MCTFGKGCYRKNPQHFLEYAHPWLTQAPSVCGRPTTRYQPPPCRIRSWRSSCLVQHLARSTRSNHIPSDRSEGYGVRVQPGLLGSLRYTPVACSGSWNSVAVLLGFEPPTSSFNYYFTHRPMCIIQPLLRVRGLSPAPLASQRQPQPRHRLRLRPTPSPSVSMVRDAFERIRRCDVDTKFAAHQAP